MSRVCLARVDRIGDLILTLPLDSLWKKYRPHDQVTWLIPENLGFIIEAVQPQVHSFSVPIHRGKGLSNQWHAAKKLALKIKSLNFDEAVLIHVPWWVAFAFFKAGVKKRVG